jgi:hypothetical protein
MVNSVGTQNKLPNINPQIPHFVKLLTNIRYGTLVIQSSMLIYNKKRYFYYKKFDCLVLQLFCSDYESSAVSTKGAEPISPTLYI